MGVDTKGCLVTSDKDAFLIAGKVSKAIKNLIEKETGLKGFAAFRQEGFSSVRVEIITFAKGLQFYFKYKGEDRMLRAWFDCDCDLKIYKDEIKGDSCIWFSLGYWGSSVEIMEGVLSELRDIGVCYIDENDCDEQGFKEV